MLKDMYYRAMNKKTKSLTLPTLAALINRWVSTKYCIECVDIGHWFYISFMTRTSQLLQDHSQYKATGILVRSWLL